MMNQFTLPVYSIFGEERNVRCTCPLNVNIVNNMVDIEAVQIKAASKPETRGECP